MDLDEHSVYNEDPFTAWTRQCGHLKDAFAYMLLVQKYHVLAHIWSIQGVSAPEGYSDIFIHILARVIFLCPQRNFGRHKVIALSVRPSVRQSVRPSVRPSRFRVRSISPIFCEVGIPNLVCGYILGWRSVAYHFRVTVILTLTSDLVFRIIVSAAYLLYYLR